MMSACAFSTAAPDAGIDPDARERADADPELDVDASFDSADAAPGSQDAAPASPVELWCSDTQKLSKPRRSAVVATARRSS